jgi:hypothetical protein
MQGFLIMRSNMCMPIFRVARIHILGLASLFIVAPVICVAAADQSKQGAVRTVASDVFSLSAPADIQVDHADSFDLASAALLEDDACVKDKPLWAGMSFEEGLNCQRQFLDVDAAY